jgi:transposase
MGKENFSDDFILDVVAQITERGYPVAEVSHFARTSAGR